jgi:hypothetical protein
MGKKPWELVDILKQVAETNNFSTQCFINVIVYALEGVLSLNDFNALKERLKEDIKKW